MLLALFICELYNFSAGLLLAMVALPLYSLALPPVHGYLGKEGATGLLCCCARQPCHVDGATPSRPVRQPAIPRAHVKLACWQRVVVVVVVAQSNARADYRCCVCLCLSHRNHRRYAGCGWAPCSCYTVLRHHPHC